MFDNRLFSTRHLIRQDEVSQGIPYSLFNYFQKPVTDLLANFSEDDPNLIILGDLNDGDLWRDNIHRMSKNAFVYRLGYGVDAGNRIKAKHMLQTPTFLSLLAQAKFLNGEVHYSEAERPLLEAWIRTHGAEKMARLFKKILIWKDDSQAQFPNSLLASLLKQDA